MSKESETLIFDLGEVQPIRKNMRFLAFRESDPFLDPVTGMNLGKDTDILGLLLPKEINQTFSKAAIIQKFTGEDIQVGDKVISK